MARKSKKIASSSSAEKVAQQPVTSQLSMTAEQAWTEIESTYRKISDLIQNLPDNEKVQLLDRFQGLIAAEIPKWWGSLLKGMAPEQLTEFLFKGMVYIGQECTEETFYAIKDMAKRVNDHYTAKPRNTERDKMIVKLHDEDKLSYGKIARKLLQHNAEWAGDDGKPIQYDAVRNAYNRMKKAHKGADKPICP